MVPVVIGMAVRASARFGPALASAPAKARLKLASDGVILAIVYNTFCNTFASGFGVPASEITALFFVLSSLLCAYKAAIFLVARYVARLNPEDVVAATFMGSQKTLAFGLPLVKALFPQSAEAVDSALDPQRHKGVDALNAKVGRLLQQLNARHRSGEEVVLNVQEMVQVRDALERLNDYMVGHIRYEEEVTMPWLRAGEQGGGGEVCAS